MSYTYLLELGEESSAECLSDIARAVPWKSTRDVGSCCFSGNATVSCHGFLSGMMSQHSTVAHGEVSLKSYVVDSRAKTSAEADSDKASTVRGAGYGWKWHGSSAKWNPESSSWKTPQCSLLEGLDEFSGTWPRWGIMLDGELLERRMPGHLTIENESGFWPTPTCQGLNGGSAHRAMLDAESLHAAMRGKTNPQFLEWLMGWPIDWTALQPLETDRFRQWCDSHGISYANA